MIKLTLPNGVIAMVDSIDDAIGVDSLISKKPQMGKRGYVPEFLEAIFPVVVTYAGITESHAVGQFHRHFMQSRISTALYKNGFSNKNKSVMDRIPKSLRERIAVTYHAYLQPRSSLHWNLDACVERIAGYMAAAKAH